ncbi:hypothetical protein XBFM1_1710007 [Xenorhabdus bovienii str. feltiae Moldova]|uniref:Uncharacterized protein n=1 Tax=Xenorhabdus bovienii str. feltiae Moldova TaxID=1398200 RepID=A0A077NPT5_XENBV|nr:hypothetical protein XBFM1_1710007 [Xenorhabdus bovienii str. feltiae Moldova]
MGCGELIMGEIMNDLEYWTECISKNMLKK